MSDSDVPLVPISLLLEAARALHLNHRELGEKMGVTKRTVQRWLATNSGVLPIDVAKLLPDLLRDAPEVARKVASAARLRLPEPVRDAAPGPAKAAPAPAEALEAVIYAACEAADVAPKVARAALAAAVARARRLGLDLGELSRLLGK